MSKTIEVYETSKESLRPKITRHELRLQDSINLIKRLNIETGILTSVIRKNSYHEVDEDNDDEDCIGTDFSQTEAEDCIQEDDDERRNRSKKVLVKKLLKTIKIDVNLADRLMKKSEKLQTGDEKGKRNGLKEKKSPNTNFEQKKLLIVKKIERAGLGCRKGVWVEEELVKVKTKKATWRSLRDKLKSLPSSLTFRRKKNKTNIS